MKTRNVACPLAVPSLLFVLHFNSASAILATWTRGGTRPSVSLFLIACPSLSLSFALALAPSRSHRQPRPPGFEETQAATGEHVSREQRQY